MKKILLASTILVGTAGFAAAETANFTFSGKASVGFGYNVTTSFGAPTISSEFTAGMMTTTDGGLEAGASITVTAAGVSMETDNTDTAFGTFSADTAGSIPDASVYLSGDWGKVTVSYDAATDGTIAYTNTWGDFKVEAAYTYSVTTADTASVKGTYSFGDYAVYAGVNASDAGGWSVTDIDFGGSAAMSGFTAAVDANYAFAGAGLLTWKASAGYATGPYSISAFVEDDDGANGLDFGAGAAYDLGGGVKLNAAYTHDDDAGVPGTGWDIVTAGVSMSF
jgi:outer membrane protein OmpU